jgi:hypothetical protein
MKVRLRRRVLGRDDCYFATLLRRDAYVVGCIVEFCPKVPRVTKKREVTLNFANDDALRPLF